MFTKVAPVALLSAAAFAAPAPAPVIEERGLIQSAYCLAQSIAIAALQQNTQATAFCSSYLSIQPVTSTVVATATQTVTALATTTVLSTTTAAKKTSTCAPAYANQKRDLFFGIGSIGISTKAITGVSTTTAALTLPGTTVSVAIATPTLFAGLSASIISADCSCLSIPTSTVITTSTSTKAVTVTATTVTTSVVTATPTAVASQLYDLNGTYTATNGAVFQLYPNLDFPQHDAYSGTCGASGDTLTTTDGTFSCLSWNDCMNICATASWGCLGVSFVPSWNYCYLKNEVPGNGLTSCGTVQSEVVQSGLNIAQGNTYAV